MTPSFWIPISVFCVGILAWMGVHHALNKKDVEQTLSRMIMVEMVSGFSFSIALFYLFIPSLFYLITKSELTWASTGILWRLATFIGGAALSLAPIGWISWLPDE